MNGSNSINAALETARDMKAPVIIQFSNGKLISLRPTSTPSNPQERDIYMDSTSHKLRVYDGAVWHDLW